MSEQTITRPAAPVAATGSDFERTTERWGRYTMLAGLVVSLAGPAYLLFVADFWPGIGPILTGFAAIAAVLGAYWVLEPITYFPMLGSAGLYQAFLIGNISNKLLPAAITAQAAIGANAGSRRAEIAAVAAICGAALVHVLSLTVLVGIGGTWLVSILPETVTASFDYIVPAILGPVLIQIMFSQKERRTAVVALLIAVAMAIVVVPQIPALVPFGMVLTVALAIALALASRSRTPAAPQQ